MAGAVIDIGALVAEKYVILESLGKGGMSNVWLARDERLGKLWAIKEIKPNVAGSRGQALRQAIVDEANLMKRLDHPAIPRVVDIIDTGSTTFVVMDYVDGRSLGDLQRLREAPFEQEDVIGWGIQLCDVLGYLHRLEPPIVYRDMKPANIMVRDDGSVRLIDFGIAMEREPGRNNDGRVVGTPGYAPPEQLPNPMPWPPPTSLDPQALVDARSDVYALGATLYTLVTGQAPRRVEDEQGHPQVSFAMQPIRACDARLSEGLEHVILRATKAEADERYQTIDEMRYDLEHHEELTEEWRATLRGRLRNLRLLLGSAVACLLMGVCCVCAGVACRQADYADLLHAASVASRDAEDGQPSEAERLYTRALALEPGRMEPYWRLLDVYTHDYRLTDDEVRRWQRAYAQASGIGSDPDYARLCFEAGTCLLSYYGIDASGGSVGNAALQSASSAAPWFRRAIDACDAAGDRADAVLDPADLRAAQVYVAIASFYEQVTRTGKEGKAATDAYRSFWQALQESVSHENEAPDAQKSPEGVRARLCQVGVEVLASSTYLAGMARAGVSCQQARDMLGALRTCFFGLESFARSPEYAEVFGPVFGEVAQGLEVADQNILNTFENPVASMGVEFGEKREEV